jgi:site-specific recombinase XerD
MYLVLNNKSSNYQLVYFRNGKRTTVSTDTANKKEADKFLASFNPEVKTETATKKTSIKLSSFIVEYKSYVKNTFSEKYLNKAVTPSFNRLQAFLPDTPLEYITSKNIDQFISLVYANSKFAASLYHRTLKAAFNKAVIWNYIQENPFNKIKSPKVVKSFPVYLSEAELILVLNKTEDQLLKDIFITAFYTGMRLNEILNMKWNWIDFNQNIITVKNSEDFKTKSKRERIIPIHNKVISILKSYSPIGKQSSNALVFYRKEGIKLNGEFISKQFKKAVRSADLNENIHFHSLRHSFASALVQRNVSLYAVKELLGHENIKTTQIYSHLQKDNLCQAVNLI